MSGHHHLMSGHMFQFIGSVSNKQAILPKLFTVIRNYTYSVVICLQGKNGAEIRLNAHRLEN